MESNIAANIAMRPAMAPGINNSYIDGWYMYKPSRPVVIYHDAPLENIEETDYCYVTSGNVKICLGFPDSIIPMQSNVSPCLTLTSVKMENHPEHIAVMFGQVLSNLK